MAKSNAGRPAIKYNKKFAPAAEKVAAIPGANHKFIALKLELKYDVYLRFRKEYPEFSEAIKRGMSEGNALGIQIAEDQLMKGVTGGQYDEITRETYNGKERVKIVRKTVQANIVAIIFYLKNRAPGRWSDKQEVELKSDALDKALRAASEELAKLQLTKKDGRK